MGAESCKPTAKPGKKHPVWAVLWIGALDTLDLMRLQLWNPYNPQVAADTCLGWLQNLRGESLAERLEMFATTMDSADQNQAEAFADRVLNPQYRSKSADQMLPVQKPVRAKVVHATAAPSSDNSTASTNTASKELPLYGPEGLEETDK